MAITIDFKPSHKQRRIFKLFDDDKTTEVVYGGSVASGKSYLLASLLVMKCLQHPGIRIGLARNYITTLKKTTLISIMEVLGNWNLTTSHYSYNSQAGIITFNNGSEIVLCELDFIPSDPKYTRLGGLLLTFGVIDEAGEIDEKGKEIYQSRLGRWKNDELGIKPFLLMTCNPSKNFLYREYYTPFKEGRLKSHQSFIQALPQDNPYLPKGYIENLEKTLSLNERRRLLFGEWEFADDDTNLFTYQDIQLIFDTSINLEEDKKPEMYLSCDIAFTSDKAIFVVWQNKTVIDIIEYEKDDDMTTVERIKQIAKDYKIKTTNISYDADGVGKYIHQYLPSAREIHNGGKPIKNQGYRNLKAELFFKLAEFVSDGTFKIKTHKYRKEIEEELSVIKHKPRENMNIIELIQKADMKRLLGRSPDIADALAYGMIFHLRNNILKSDDFIFMDF